MQSTTKSSFSPSEFEPVIDAPVQRGVALGDSRWFRPPEPKPVRLPIYDPTIPETEETNTPEEKPAIKPRYPSVEEIFAHYKLDNELCELKETVKHLENKLSDLHNSSSPTRRVSFEFEWPQGGVYIVAVAAVAVWAMKLYFFK